MSLIGAIIRLLVLGSVIGLLLFTGMMVFALVAGVMVVLGIAEWLRRKNILNEDFPKPPPVPEEPEDVVMEHKVFEAQYIEMDRKAPPKEPVE